MKAVSFLPKVNLYYFQVGVFPPVVSNFEDALRESSFFTSSLKEDVK
jgi:hypothetical protein